MNCSTDGDMRRRFPAFNVADGDRGYFEPTGGFLHPEACIAAQLDEAARLGATLQFGETVLGFTPSAGGVAVKTAQATYAAGRIVLSAGAWLPKLLPDGYSGPFTVRRQVLGWFRIDDEQPRERYRPEAFPVFIWQTPRKQTIYGFPWVGTREPALKVATEQYDSTTTRRRHRPRGRTPANSTRCMKITSRISSRAATATAIKSAVCMYTCVDHARFIVDALPGRPNVIVVSPCSGHGFKHSAAIGEAVAKFAIEGAAPELAPFAWPA